MRHILVISVLVLILAGCCFADVSIQEKTGNILVDGKPFFPIGLYLTGDSFPSYVDLGFTKSIGFNCLVFGKKPTAEAVAKLEKAGLVALELPKDLPLVEVDDVAKFESLPVDKRPSPKLFIIKVPSDMLENAVARSIIAGGKGVIYELTHFPQVPVVKVVHPELEQMSKIALAPFPIEHPLVVEDRMQVMYKEIDDKRYILAANITPKPQSLCTYLPDSTSKPTMIIGREELVFFQGLTYQIGFEKYGITMFSWPRGGK